jgi:hypothetical protein
MVPYFEGRELKTYGDYVRAAELVEGRVYFRVSYLDQDRAIPELVPLVFVGRNLDPEQRGLYFQDASSYIAGERYDATDWESVNSEEDVPRRIHMGPVVSFETMPETEFATVLDFEQALDLLLGVSIRRNKWDGQVRPIVPHAEAGSLEARRRTMSCSGRGTVTLPPRR